MFIPYCTIGEDIEVAHTPIENEHTKVRIEIPDEKYCFKVFECIIPGYEIVTDYGLNEIEKSELLKFCEKNAHLILYYAANGGICNAEPV